MDVSIRPVESNELGEGATTESSMTDAPNSSPLQPTFSIVTISFNQVQFLRETIESVLSQTYPYVEYVVVDPGSTDGSRELIRRYRDRISHIIFEPDLGPADGLNRGFAKTKGDLLGFLNSDDVLYPDALQRVAHYFSRHPRIGVVSGHCDIIDGSGLKLRKMFSDRYNIRAAAHCACYLAQAATFFRRSAFRATDGFNNANRVNWDAELWIDMAKAGTAFGRINAVLAGFRLHKQGITGSGSLKKLHEASASNFFRTILGRDPVGADEVRRMYYRLRRLVTNPRAYWETLAHGPIFGRTLVDGP